MPGLAVLGVHSFRPYDPTSCVPQYIHGASQGLVDDVQHAGLRDCIASVLEQSVQVVDRPWPTNLLHRLAEPAELRILPLVNLVECTAFVIRRLHAHSRCLRCLLLVMCTHPFAREALTLHLARSERHERYFGCNLMHRKVLASSHQHLMEEAPWWRCNLVRSPAAVPGRSDSSSASSVINNDGDL